MVEAAQLVHAPLHCDIAPALRGHIAVMGNMDGVHRGHQMLVQRTVDLAREAGAPSAAIVFEPHPRRVFQPDGPPFQLTDLTTKQALLGDLGIKTVFALPFIEALYKQTPAQFVTENLHQRLGLSGIVTGTDFQFGKGRSGNAEALAELAASVGMTAHAIEPLVADGDEKLSSSAVRAALREGHVEAANHILGRPWAIRGPVTEGRKLARTLDFPTANIPLGDYLRPRFGVYIISATVNGETFAGVANIGVRPTVDGTHEVLEAHLFDFDRDIYGAQADIQLHHFLREEQKFDGLPALKAQIAEDAEAARAWHAAHSD